MIWIVFTVLILLGAIIGGLLMIRSINQNAAKSGHPGRVSGILYLFFAPIGAFGGAIVGFLLWLLYLLFQ